MSRLAVQVKGIVQGVGFRPFVYHLAQRLGLSGWVMNDGSGVSIEAQGQPAILEAFCRLLREEAPSLAVVESIVSQTIEPLEASSFYIRKSVQTTISQTLISPDIAICEACRHELLDPTNRRYHYPFINCTECGPRYTIVRGLPYDRPATTMAGFLLCPSCRREYTDPADRRFHAQPNACPECGPRYRLLDGLGRETMHEDVMMAVRNLVATGGIAAIKGVGGWHLACNASDKAAVAELRSRKHREEKPFAVMIGSLETARYQCQISADEQTLLTGKERPIVILAKSRQYNLAEPVAPGNPWLGVMLPYAPVHYLLLDPGDVWVMTSGNRSDEPIAYKDEDAVIRLSGIADCFLTHNRPIERQVDDSVVRIFANTPYFIRRSRGYAPAPIRLNMSANLLAVGGELKNTFCLMRGTYAFVSNYMGDLSNEVVFQSFQQSIEQYQRLFSVEPNLIAHDLHPSYLSTRYALASGRPLTGVQHHHAHIAAVMAEHGLKGPVIGVALDGTGYGDDGSIWGGEFLVSDLVSYRRAAHFTYIPLPGGEKAIREPWRLAAWLLHTLKGEEGDVLPLPFTKGLPPWWRSVAAMPAKGINSPLTSSAGRLFDAVAALLDVRGCTHYEGQAAIELEWLAGKRTAPVLPYTVSWDEPVTIDFLPVLAAIIDELVAGSSPDELAAAFHTTVAQAVFEVVSHLAKQTGIKEAVLGGGVFQNMRLLTQTVDLLKQAGIIVYLAYKVPTNDGGISLGQAAIAAARQRKGLA